MRLRPGWQRALAGALVCSVWLSALPAIGEEAKADDEGAGNKNENIAVEGGLGAGAALASIVWAPLKLVYAFGGLVIGGLGYAWSGADGEVSKRVLKRSLAGDYVITPKHLKGEKKFRFAGGGDM